jgi:putative ABC transport system substrate-binding protein
MRGLSRTLVLAVAVMLLAIGGATGQTPARTARVGLLSAGADPASDFRRAFLEGLRERGWEEGRNLVIEQRFTGGEFEQLPRLVSELRRLNLDVLVASGGVAAQAARDGMGPTPIVMTNVSDPVGMGLVSGLARPGGTITGFSTLSAVLVAKRVQLLKEMVPAASRLALLVNPANPGSVPQIKPAEEAAARLGISVMTFKASRLEDLDRAFTEMKAQRSEALLVLGDPFFAAQRVRIIGLAASTRIPANFSSRVFTSAGGLSSYGTDFTDLYRRAAVYVDKILRGAKPADLPIEQPTTFELIVNLKTARGMGLTIPPSVIARADRVIQ